MSLGIAFKGPEGIVLAADSRVTLMAQMQQPNLPTPMLLPASYDNATKLLRIKGQDYVGAVTYGAGVIGRTEPRTAHSFIPEFEQELISVNVGRLSTEDFATRLGEFFLARWNAGGMGQVQPGEDMFFLIGGYDVGSAYGRVFEVAIPNRPAAVEYNAGTFGVTWGGQTEFTERLLNGYDRSLGGHIQQFLTLDDTRRDALIDDLKPKLAVAIPYQFLPLQDCVSLAIFIIRTTITLQTWQVGVRGVGGSIDLATITRTEGFNYIQQKEISGEKGATQ
jgi:hypothetical protein